ncbi:hypothetical protein BST11_01945 [Mycobacterium alsense]|uniref:Nuclear transport factor 2 family protein n=1 Tax=Mycobacterium alsense TaxID=324058 RepID=A0AA41XL16_9MYCO|nr:hypothetical protein [Mycobacterium alsense]MCV7378106.1 nuclear transport factor 2 family protein [Mycobacterium alsense]OQZ93415.1 hypothetical protein BST11_01945 [Mycobacterium alsense]
MSAQPTKLAAATAALAAAAIAASCSVVTGGTAISPRTSAPTSPVGAAPANPSAAPAPPTTESAEDQIRQTVMAFQDAYNTQNWDAYTELMCSAMRVEFTGPTMDYLKKTRVQNGLTTVKVTSVAITGDTATATMDAQNEALGFRSVSLPLKLEDGWKICKP